MCKADSALLIGYITHFRAAGGDEARGKPIEADYLERKVKFEFPASGLQDGFSHLRRSFGVVVQS